VSECGTNMSTNMTYHSVSIKGIGYTTNIWMTTPIPRNTLNILKQSIFRKQAISCC